MAVGVWGLRFGETGGFSTSKPQAQQQHNEDLLNLDGDSARSSPLSSDASSPSHNNSGSSTPKQYPSAQESPANPNQPHPQKQSNILPPGMMLPKGTSEK